MKKNSIGYFVYIQNAYITLNCLKSLTTVLNIKKGDVEEESDRKRKASSLLVGERKPGIMDASEKCMIIRFTPHQTTTLPK